MKVTIEQLALKQYTKYSGPPAWSFVKGKKTKELDLKGLGLKKDPILFDGSLPRRFGLEDHKFHSLGKNLKFGICYLKNCENIIFEKCFFREIKLDNCSNIIFTNCIIYSELRMNVSSNIRLEDCYIFRSYNNKSSQNTFSKSNFIEIRDWSSKSTTFTENQIRLLTINVKEDTFVKRNTLIRNTIVNQSHSNKELFRFPPKHFWNRAGKDT